jgi:hypothetical protein
MLRKFKHKRVKATLAVVLALVVAGAAFAFWTAGGTGSGSGTVANGASVDFSGVSVDAGLAPGGAATYNYTITNNTGSTLKVTSVSADTTAVDGLNTGCLASDFTVDSSTVPLASQSLAASGGTYSGTGTIHMADTSASQDDCKNSPITLHLKAN